eukprot:TRINITY_DN3460_c0_g2_i2.p1 TRINITY_DN3460_c0_g2~~TRINITY_DN3460_c0_g2_i2.p1  ORF type:complete len:320 (-),score=50.87 TRINITY_DN3460_c0_g2_i2:298-1257(-)
MINKKGLQIKGSPSISRSLEKNTPSEVEISDITQLKDLGDVLGSGSSGAVTKVQHRETKKIYALKVIPLVVTEDTRKKILQELRTLHESSHESIVRFYGAFYNEGAIRIALEFMDCGTLADLVKVIGPIPENVIAKITLQLLKGVAYLHKGLHIIHRDIKPCNLLLNSQGDVKISDFGVCGKLASTIGKAQTFVGTVTYMSPERINGEDYNSSSDIWSLGLTILECAFGYYPYSPPGKKAQLLFFELLEHIVQQPVPLPSTEKFSKEFVSFISKCLQKSPEARWTALQLLEHPFILNSKKDSLDLASWIKSSLTKMGKL